MAASSDTTFPSLPLELQELVLSQALEQLDNKHKFGIAPCVNQQWHSLSLSTCRTLNLEGHLQQHVQPLRRWMSKNKGVLADITLRHQGGTYHGVKEKLQSADLVEAICENTQLQSLALTNIWLMEAYGRGMYSSDNNIARNLTDLTSLTRLRLNCSPQMSAAVAQIFQLTTLRSLQLRDSIFSTNDEFVIDDFINGIGKNLKQLTSLEVSLTRECIMLDRFPSSLLSLQHLQQLRMEGFMILPKDLPQAARLPWVAIAVRVQHDQRWAETTYQQWMQQQSLLQDLSLRSPSRGPTLPAAITTTYLSCLPSAPMLRSLLIRKWDLVNGGACLSALTNLTSLSLEYCTLAQQTLSHIASMSSLKVLTLLGNTVAADSEHDIFRSMAASCLQSFTISRQLLVSQDFRAIGSMQQLTKLSLEGIVPVEALSCFTDLTKLVTLEIGELQMRRRRQTSTAVAAISKLSNLESLCITTQDKRFRAEDVITLMGLKNVTFLQCTCKDINLPIEATSHKVRVPKEGHTLTEQLANICHYQGSIEDS